MHTTLEKRAISLAAGNSLCFEIEGPSFYEEYMKVINDFDNGKEPENCNKYQPFENWNWEDLINHISNESDFILMHFKQLLEDAKTGLIKSATDCTLDSDLTTLCMQGMVDKGINKDDLDKYIMGDEPMTCSKCGSRTDFEIKPDCSQKHECLKCGYIFLAVENID